MKKISIAILCLTSLYCLAQDTKTEFDGKKWKAPYQLSIPTGWDVERFLIPIEFAPQIQYKGVEDIRFTPGWGNVKSNEYWTYAFLWYLDGYYKINKNILENNLRAYYTGLVGRNIEPRKIPASKVIPVKTFVKQVTTSESDLKTFNGTIELLDYMEQRPITLNCIIHVRPYKEKGKTFIFYELSPKPFSESIWLKLNELWTDFDYKKP